MNYTKTYRLIVELHEVHPHGADHSIRSFLAEVGNSKLSAIRLFHSIYEHVDTHEFDREKGESNAEIPENRED